MTVQEIIDYARNLAWVREDEIDNNIILDFLNVEYRKLRQRIADTDKNYGLCKYTQNLVAWVSSYALKDVVESPNAETWQIKIDSLYLKYDSWQKYRRRANLRDWDNLDYDPERFSENQNSYDPFYIITNQEQEDTNTWEIIRRTALQIFPAPTVTVTDGIVLYANQRPYKLTISMWESDILLEDEFHDVLSRATIPYIYQYRQQDDRVLYYQQQYEGKVKEMMRLLKRRNIRPMVWYEPDFTRYVYWNLSRRLNQY